MVQIFPPKVLVYIRETTFNLEQLFIENDHLKQIKTFCDLLSIFEKK